MQYQGRNAHPHVVVELFNTINIQCIYPISITPTQLFLPRGSICVSMDSMQDTFLKYPNFLYCYLYITYILHI